MATTYTMVELEEMNLLDLKALARELKVNVKQRKADILAEVIEALDDASRISDPIEDEEEDEEVVELLEEDDITEIIEDFEDEDEDEEDDPTPTPEELKAAKDRHPSARAKTVTKTATKTVEKTIEPAGETYTAKQVATRIGTDAKTLRKFLRSADSPFEPVGQGGRYEFEKEQLSAIKAAFEAWHAQAATRRPKVTGRGTKATPAVIEEVEEELEDEELEFDDSELEELEDTDLELDDEEEEED